LATGANSVIDLPNVTTITNGIHRHQDILITAELAGAIRLPRLTQLVDQNTGDTHGRAILVQASGANSRISMPLLTSFIDRNPNGDNNPADGAGETFGMSAMTISSGGVIEIPALTNLNAVALSFSLTGTNQTISLTKITSLTSSTLTLQGPGRIDGNPDAQLTVTGGSISLAGTSVFSLKKLVLDSSATLSGTGTIIGDFENRSTIAPGTTTTPGKITIQGNYTQASAGKLVIDLAGNSPGTNYDQLSITGTATLGGNLQVVQRSGYSPSGGTSFQPVVAQSLSGQFNSTSGLTLANGSVLQVAYAADKVILIVPGNGEGEGPSLADYFLQWSGSLESNAGFVYGPIWIGNNFPSEFSSSATVNGVLAAEGEFLGEGEDGGPGSAPAALPEEWEYDTKFNQLLRHTDGNGDLTLYTIDPANGNRVSMRRVMGLIDSTQNGETDDLVTTFTYTTFGLIDKVTDPLGRVTDYDYDSIGRLTKLTEAAGTAISTVETYEYDLYGNMTARIDTRGNRSTMEYDVMNRMTRMTTPDPDGDGPLTASSTTLEYDAMGQLIRTVDARNSETRMTYDAMGRVLTQTNDASKTTRNQYDLAGNLIAVTDPNGNTTRYKYDVRKRMTESIAADGGVTKYEYDLADNLTALTDPVGNRTQFRYDARDRMIEEIDPLGKSIRYEYDGVGNIVAKVDRNGRTTSFEYDDADRLVKETWRNADGSTANVIQYTYDKSGNLLIVQDQFSKLTYAYDALNRPIEVKNAGTPNAPSVELDYAYDPAGNIASVTDTVFGNLGGTTSYSYDGQNRMTSVAQNGTGVDPKLVDFVYNELGQFSQIDRFSDLQRTSLVARSRYSYDDLNRLTSLTHGSVASPRSLAFYDYEYDAADRITAITDIDGRSDYRYDVTNQLTGATRGSSDVRGNESYTYDKNGNRISSHLASSYTTGKANRLLSDGTYNYEYDAEGNMSRRTQIATGEVRDFTWDHRNRLVRVTDKSAGGIIINEALYTYDALNRRIAKTVDSDGTGPTSTITEHFAYDGEHITLEFSDSDGPGTAQQPILAVRNLFGPKIDMILAQEYRKTNTTQWFFVNQILSGETTKLSSNIDTYQHLTDSFGNKIPDNNQNEQIRFGFSGREFDASVSLYYFRSRYYDSQVGRFVSEDTIGFNGADANLRRMSGNNPISNRDPRGTAWTNITGRWYPSRPSYSDIESSVIGSLSLGEPSFVPRLNPGERIGIGLLQAPLSGTATGTFGIACSAEKEGQCGTRERTEMMTSITISASASITVGIGVTLTPINWIYNWPKGLSDLYSLYKARSGIQQKFDSAIAGVSPHAICVRLLS
jgi:RHS repeat-associated protein